MVWCQAQVRWWPATTWPVAEHPHPVQVGGHLDAPADHRRVHRVVVGVQPHVVVAGQPRGGRHPVTGATGGRASIAARSAAIRSAGAQPSARRGRVFASASHCRELGVEVRRAGEHPAGQERALQVVMGPLDQPLGFRVGGACR